MIKSIVVPPPPSTPVPMSQVNSQPAAKKKSSVLEAKISTEKKPVAKIIVKKEKLKKVFCM